MQLVATTNGIFFRAISVTESDTERAKETMLKDKADLEFKIMVDEEFEYWLEKQQA